MARREVRVYSCGVVHEQVKIYLCREKQVLFSGNGSRSAFVQCDQGDCQYVDKNELPCPLHVGMFPEHVERHDDG